MNQIAFRHAKVLEGLPGTNGRPALRAYQDSAGVWTIGFGHTKGVQRGMVCTDEQASDWLLDDLTEAQAYIARTTSLRGSALNENQRAALQLFVLNIGGPRWAASTLLKKLNAGDLLSVPAQMQRWVFVTDPETKKPVKSRGLVNRRAAEVALWLTPVNAASPADNDNTRGLVPATPPQPEGVMQTSTGKAAAGAAGASVIALMSQAEPAIDAIQRVGLFDAGGPGIFQLVGIVCCIGAIGFTAWTLYERWRKLRENGQ